MTDRSTLASVVEVPAPEHAADGARLRVLYVPPESISDGRVTNLPLATRTYEHAVALPVVEPPGYGYVLGAVYDEDGWLVRPTQRARPGRRWRSNPAALDDLALRTRDAVRLPGRTFLGGSLTHVFGHVLLETLARFWRDLDYTTYDQVLLYPVIELRGTPTVPDLTKRVLELVGVRPDRIKVVDRRPIILDQVDVTPSPIRMSKAADPRLTEVFDRIASTVAASSTSPHRSRIYLSRRRLEDRRRATNEFEIEVLMSERGFVVIHPQELPLDEQIRLIRAADVIAGCDGSALHAAAFARPGTRLLALDTRRTPNQVMIGWTRGLDAVHVNALDGELVSRRDEWTADLDRVQVGLDLILEG